MPASTNPNPNPNPNPTTNSNLHSNTTTTTTPTKVMKTAPNKPKPIPPVRSDLIINHHPAINNNNNNNNHHTEEAEEAVLEEDILEPEQPEVVVAETIETIMHNEGILPLPSPPPDCTHWEKSSKPPMVTLPVPLLTLDEFYYKMWSDTKEAIVFWTSFHDSLGYTDQSFGKWTPRESQQQQQQCCLTRPVSFRVHLNNTLGPKSTRATQTQGIRKKGNCLLIEQSTKSLDVPSADAFTTEVRWECIYNEGIGINVSITHEVKFTKSVWGIKGMIEKGAQEGGERYLTAY